MIRKFKKKKIILVVCMMAGLIAISGAAYLSISANTVGTGDPVVTLSYLKEVFLKDVINIVNNTVDQRLMNSDQTSPGYSVVEVKAGNSIVADAEGTELILRSGIAIIVAPLKNQGLTNMTTGTDAVADEKVIKNNLYIIPRADGRGFKATADMNVMVRGVYKIIRE